MKRIEILIIILILVILFYMFTYKKENIEASSTQDTIIISNLNDIIKYFQPSDPNGKTLNFLFKCSNNNDSSLCLQYGKAIKCDDTRIVIVINKHSSFNYQYKLFPKQINK